ncbi:MAG: Bax inhibitor-1/YccA family protein [Alloprevotella sp.]|nr:Bax inhibitor-1/YccA family protein [Alloprevotella sp.]
MDFEPRYLREEGIEMEGSFASLMKNVYLWMTLGLAITGLTAFFLSHRLDIMTTIASSPIIFGGIIIGELAVVIILSARIMKLSFAAASIMFGLYAILTGVTFAFIFLSYSVESITTTFLVTAGTFAGMSFVGYTTKKDLSVMGKVLYMLLIGLIIATLVNIFLGNSLFDFILSILGVAIFTGLTAWDTQKIKKMFIEYYDAEPEMLQKLSVLASLTLYLDFINLFLYLLRFMGRDR